ncbi:flavin reductase family protein [Achromobacter sp. GG226]|uniref:flavin reductase family protein n=1 Tax=Verticiella alkaliphila TaxID=2779529 RepID=UPI001C0B1D41|nr:flavin reductase family protein [Verticiella sp. GG226]MBU4611838.1 flavin reductase family protein [Verticiella sp. GG226]
MYYEPGNTDHGLPFNPFKSCVVPRPIGWISTLDANGVANLAPYSQFQNITFDPPIVMFSANQDIHGERKDTTVHAEREGSFVWNMATYDLREAVNLTAQSLPRGQDEFAHAGLEKAPSRLVRPWRVAASPVQFECEYLQTVRLPGNPPMGTVDVVFGRVVAIHIADDAITDGKLDIARIKPLARLGYFDYTYVDKTFTMRVPNAGNGGGMEGSPEKVAEAALAKAARA